MVSALSGIGLNLFDMALLVCCPFGAVIGSLAQAIMLTIHPQQIPNKEGERYLASIELQEARGNWLGLRLMLGAILGLVIGLYFIGSIHETATVLAKIMALSIIAGYAAPKVWLQQEKQLLDTLTVTQ